MKRHLYGLMAIAGLGAVIIAAMVSGAIAQTMGEYGASTAGAASSAGAGDQGALDSQAPGTVWTGATKFPEANQLSGKSSFPETDRFSSSAHTESSDRFASQDRFPQTGALDSSQDRFDTKDRWSQDSWGK
ncbi:MAG: hypothetical protein ACYDC3_09270 [Candidatus Binataceae bacterium]